MIAGVVPRGWCSLGSSGGRAISPKAPCLRCGPLGDRSLPGRSSGDRWGCTTRLVFSGELWGWGDFSDSAASAVPDRSEIGPYPRGRSGKQHRSYHPLSNLRQAPGVGRCLRQRHVHSVGPLGDRSLPRRAFGRAPRPSRSLSRNASSGWAQRRHRAISVNKATAVA